MFGRLFALAGFSLPDFYLGVLLLLAFSLHFDWFPMLGGGEGFLDTCSSRAANRHPWPGHGSLHHAADTIVAAGRAETRLCPHRARKASRSRR